MIQELFVKLAEMSDADRAHAVESGDVETIVHELTARHGAEPEQYGEQPQDIGEAETTTDESGYDEQAWGTYLSENGPAWDGTEQSWEQYTQWFLYYAEERGVKAPATALIDYLTAQPATERISTFAQYGVTITQATQEPDTAAAASAEIDTMMADVLAEDPSLADIPEERRREILAEVLGQK